MDITARASLSLDTQVEMADFLRFSPDSQLLAVGGSGGPLEIWNLASGQRVHHNPTPILVAGWAATGPIVSDGHNTWTEPIGEPPTSATEGFAAFARSSRGALVGLAASNVQVRDPSGEVLAQYPRGGGCFPMQGLSISPDGSRVALARTGKLLLWKIPDPAPLELTTFSERDVTAVAFHPSAPVLAFGTMGGSICLHATGDGEMIFQGPVGAEIRSVRWSPDGTLLAVGCADQSSGALLFPVHPRQGLGDPAVIDFNPTGDCVFVLDFSPDGRYLATAGRNNRIALFPLDPKSNAGANPEYCLEYLSWLYSSQRYQGVLDTLPFVESRDWDALEKGWKVFFQTCAAYMLNDTEAAWAMRTQLGDPHIDLGWKNLSYCYSLCIELAGLKGDAEAACSYADLCLALRSDHDDKEGIALARGVARQTLAKLNRPDLVRKYEDGLLTRVRNWFKPH